MSKKRERLNFKWQKSQNEYIFSVTLLLALFAIRNEFEGTIKIIVWAVVFPILIFLSAWGLFSTNVSKFEYLNSLRDKRFKESKSEKIKMWIILILSLVVAALIVYFALDLWKVLFKKNFS